MTSPCDDLASSRKFEALNFEQGFASLGSAFHTRVQPESIESPYLVGASDSAARLLGLDPQELSRPEVIEVLAGNRLPSGVQAYATVYSGHQFGNWAGQLGDGRALLLGQVPGANGERWEMQLKGAGLTPFSRMGDGRAVLRSSIREFLCSEAMDALGIPTTRALSVVGADLPVFRETVETAAVVTRLAPSFLRFGHFEHFYYSNQHDRLRELADYLIDNFYPELRDSPKPAQALLQEITRRTAVMVAGWQSVGFCHGVMNTDNMSVLGLTIDYGPFGFLDGFDPDHVCNHSDSSGRYSYANQPGIAEWNCYCLAQAMLPLLDSVDEAKEALAAFRPAYAAEFSRRFAAKLGLCEWRDGDEQLLSQLLKVLADDKVDFTRFFRSLAGVRVADDRSHESCRELFANPSAFDAWSIDYRRRIAADAMDDAARAHAMNQTNPAYVLRNHLAEIAIRQARGQNERQRLGLSSVAPGRSQLLHGQFPAQASIEPDYSEVRRLLAALRQPFEEKPEFADLAMPPPEWAGKLQVSCSS